MNVHITDGGRAEAGFKGSTDDCVTRAIAIATGMPYSDVYHLVNDASSSERGRKRKGKVVKSSARTGVFTPTVRKLMQRLGWEWVPTMGIGTGCKVHLRKDELPSGRLIVKVTRHVCAVIEGVIHDTHDPSRDGQRCVYGYYIKR